MAPASPHPCTLFWPRSGEMPDPAKPICPEASEKLSSACALAVPFVCWVMPMPQMRQEPAKAGFAYQRTACAMVSRGTPVTLSA